MTNSNFDYLKNRNDIYEMKFRAIRFKLTDNSYEAILTNFSREEFPIEEIKKLYNKRWGIETSFMHLKYAIGLNHFHSRKKEFIYQEIYGKLIMYNYCEKITRSVVIKQNSKKKHTYQVNYSMAFTICLHHYKKDYIDIDVK